jgi:hypothetical protein
MNKINYQLREFRHHCLRPRQRLGRMTAAENDESTRQAAAGSRRVPLACGKSWPSAARGRAAPPSISRDRSGWPKNPRALAGRLRRAQTFLRVLGIDIKFSREGRAGTRIIRIRATQENTVSTVSTVPIGRRRDVSHGLVALKVVVTRRR